MTATATATASDALDPNILCGGSPGSEARLLAQARISQQYQQLGLQPAPIGTLTNTVSPAPQGFSTVTPTFLNRQSQ